MARVCQVTGKKPMSGNNVSHANNKTQAAFSAQSASIAASGSRARTRWVRLRVSNAGLRTIDKKGIDVVLADLRAAAKSNTSRGGANLRTWTFRKEYRMREKIKLESSAGTGHFYTTTKNKRTKPDKIEIKKFDPVARKHVIYKETKIK